MEIVCLAVGRLKSGPESELCARYLDRARKGGRALGFKGPDLVEFAEGRGTRAADRMDAEADAILRHPSLAGARMVAMTPLGRDATSEEWADDLRRMADTGAARTAYLIGGPDGLAPRLTERADDRLAFGRATFPHQLVRILLAEQLYRVTTILAGHPYHRAGIPADIRS